MIAIINYGIGNLASIQNMFKKAAVDATISNERNEIAVASKIILPGIGHFDHCMKEFNASGLRPLIEKRVLEDRVPVLGVCVGCQMLMQSSEEGSETGLGWIEGRVVRFRSSAMPPECKIPHMSWTDVHPRKDHLLYAGIADPRFYFVHSYHLEADPEFVTATADYGYRFVASVGSGNIQGVQFHPEKSHKFGMQLYSNFAKNF